MAFPEEGEKIYFKIYFIILFQIFFDMHLIDLSFGLLREGDNFLAIKIDFSDKL